MEQDGESDETTSQEPTRAPAALWTLLALGLLLALPVASLVRSRR